MRSTMRCIYCKETKPEPRRGEHIVHDGLGGSTCIKDVCEQCNTVALKKLDWEFLRNSPVAYARLFLSTRGEVRSPQFVPSQEIDGWLDCNVRAPATVKLIPQVVVRDSKVSTLIERGDNEVAHAALRKLEKLGTDAVHIDVDARPENKPTRLVMRLNEKGTEYSFTLRAQSQGEAHAFLEALKTQSSGWSKELAWSDIDLKRGSVDVRTTVDVNVPGRSAAKIAFNLLAQYFGPEVALRSEFDQVRDYIRGIGVLPVEEVVAADGEAGLSVDRRFVGPWYEAEPAKHWSALPDGHTVSLHCERGMVRALVHLFGGQMSFAVELGTLGPDAPLDKPLPVFFFVPSSGSGDEELTLEAMIARSVALAVDVDGQARNIQPALPDPEGNACEQ